MTQAVKFPLMLLAICTLMPMPAFAYMGPGAGLTAIGCLIALLAGIWYTFKGFLWLPLKRLLKKDKEAEVQPAEQEQNAAAEANDAK